MKDLEFKVMEKTSKKGKQYKALFVIINGVENFVCYVK